MCICRQSRIDWSTESKAADKSNITNIARSPLSMAMRISDNTFSTAVSVEWCAWYGDCSSGSSLCLSRCSSNCLATKCSSSFDNTVKLERLEDARQGTSRQRLVRGLSGMVPTPWCCFEQGIDIGSDRQCLFGSWRTAMMMSSSVNSSKRCSELLGMKVYLVAAFVSLT